MPEALSFLFSHAFMLRALVVGGLISLCCALLGVSLVLKRFSMIGDGLSHVGFGALAIACAANIAPLYFSIPIVILAAFALLALNEKGRLKGDAAIALISTGALAVGVMVTSMTTGMNVDIYNYMFGSILAMSRSDVALSAVLSVAVIALFFVFYDEIFAVTFDESFAKATGTRVSAYNMLLAALTAVTIVVGMRMMGALLISSLIIFPTVTSMRVCKSFGKVTAMSVAVSLVCFFTGLLVSVRFEAPTGASVVCVNIAVLLVFSLLGFVQSRSEKSRLFRFKKPLCVLLALLLIAALALPLFGPVRSEADDRPQVVATGFAPYDFARQIAGGQADVTMLLKPGEESHTFEPTPQDIDLIQQSDVFVFGGGESDTWADSILQSLDSDKTHVVRMMDCVALEEEQLLDGMQPEADTDEEETEYDEHVWTSVPNAMQISDAVCDALCSADKANEADYRANNEAFQKELSALDAAFRALAEQKKGQSFLVGDRFPFLYFAKEYGFSFYAAFPGCAAETEANPATIGYLIDKAKRENIRTVFRVDLSPGNVAQTIAEGCGAKVETLWSCHVISAEDFENGETYLSLMQRNLRALRNA
jgi:zinc transport system permease protein